MSAEDTSIRALSLTRHTVELLERKCKWGYLELDPVLTVGDALREGPGGLLKRNGFGRKRLKILADEIAKLGLELR